MKIVRYIDAKEQRRRGCAYCADMAALLNSLPAGKKVRSMRRFLDGGRPTALPCPHVSCPHVSSGGEDFVAAADRKGAVADYIEPLPRGKSKGDLCHED